MAESEKTPERSPESAQLDEAAIRRLQDDLPDDEVLYDLAELFRVFGDSTRIKILYALFESELCVNDIAQVVGISQSAVSHQLRLLKTSKLVKFRREGKAMYYSLDDDHVRSMIARGHGRTLRLRADRRRGPPPALHRPRLRRRDRNRRRDP